MKMHQVSKQNLENVYDAVARKAGYESATQVCNAAHGWDWTIAEFRAFCAPKKWAASVVAAYDGPHGPKGTVISRHRTIEAAEKKAKGNNWLKVIA